MHENAWPTNFRCGLSLNFVQATPSLEIFDFSTRFELVSTWVSCHYHVGILHHSRKIPIVLKLLVNFHKRRLKTNDNVWTVQRSLKKLKLFQLKILKIQLQLTHSSPCQSYVSDAKKFYMSYVRHICLTEGHVNHRCPKQTIHLHYVSKAKHFSNPIFPKLSNSYVAFIIFLIY